MRRRLIAACSVLLPAAVAVAGTDKENAQAAKAACEKDRYDCQQLANSAAGVCSQALGAKGTAYDKYWQKRYKMTSAQRAWCEGKLAEADNEYTAGTGHWNQAGQAFNSGDTHGDYALQCFNAGQWVIAVAYYDDAREFYATAAADYADAALRYDDCKVLAGEVSAFCDSIP